MKMCRLLLSVAMFLVVNAIFASEYVSLDIPTCLEPNAKSRITRQYKVIDKNTTDQILTLDLNSDGLCDRIHARFQENPISRPNGPRDLFLHIALGQQNGWKDFGATLEPNGKIGCGLVCQNTFIFGYAEYVYPVMIDGKKEPHLVFFGDNPSAIARYIVRWNSEKSKVVVVNPIRTLC